MEVARRGTTGPQGRPSLALRPGQAARLGRSGGGLMGHVQDRGYRPKKDQETGKVVHNARGKPEMEKTELYGVGMRYRVRYVDPSGNERSKAFPDKQKRAADDFLTKVEHEMNRGSYTDPDAGK